MFFIGNTILNAIAYIKYADLIHGFMFENATTKNTTNPKSILISCDKANGCHEPCPAEYNTTIDIAKTIHIGAKSAHENRAIFSDKRIIFALETRV